jgi:hypothetical protein
MKNKICILLAFMVICISGYPQQIEWKNNYGGSGYDRANAIEPTSDDGFIVIGNTSSGDGDIYDFKGQTDIWVLKLNAFGDTLWTKTFGGSDTETGTKAIEISTGGYMVTGSAKSNDGDIHGNHGNMDFWVAKLNNTGDTLWTKCYGGSSNEFLYNIIEIPGEQFVLVGNTLSNDGDVHNNNGSGSTDFWVVKIDANGDTLWTRCYGGSSYEDAYAVILENKENLLVAGKAYSSDGDVGDNNGNNDLWIIRTDLEGNLLHENNFGGSDDDVAYSIKIASDSSILLSGNTTSTDQDVHGQHGGGGFFGSSDQWTIKLNKQLDTVWTSCLGGTADDSGDDLALNFDNNFMVGGYAKSTDGDLTGKPSSTDGWVIKYNMYGDVFWHHSFGGTGEDYITGITESTDSGLVFCGYTNSVNGDIPGNKGNYDLWIAKIQQQCADYQSFDTVLLNGDSIKVGNHYYKHAGVYRDTLTNAAMCDSIIITRIDSMLTTKIILGNFNESIILFPNPTKNNVNINFKNIQKTVALKLISPSGTIIDQNKFSDIKSILYQLPEQSGMYIIMIEAPDSRWANIKVLKQ